MCLPPQHPFAYYLPDKGSSVEVKNCSLIHCYCWLVYRTYDLGCWLFPLMDWHAVPASGSRQGAIGQVQFLALPHSICFCTLVHACVHSSSLPRLSTGRMSRDTRFLCLHPLSSSAPAVQRMRCPPRALLFLSLTGVGQGKGVNQWEDITSSVLWQH